MDGSETGGLITYHRTDSTTLSDKAINESARVIKEMFGADYYDGPRRYQTKVKNAQEAHEAIRPTDFRLAPSQLERVLDSDDLKLYELIWKRTMASQMVDARLLRTTMEISAKAQGNDTAVLTASGKAIEFAGFRRAYVEGSDDPAAELEEQEAILPQLAVGDRVNRAGTAVTLAGVDAKRHETLPPARFTEASLIKELERLGIGRPSTYASIIDKISSARGYVFKQGNALVPSWTAFAKTQLLEMYFGHLVDYRFTAQMEEVLDKVAEGQAEVEKWLDEFYFGRTEPGLKQLVSQEHLDTIEMSVVNAIPIGRDADGNEISVRVWRNGESLHRGEIEKCTMPDGVLPDELTVERAEEILAKGTLGPRELGIEPESGLPIIVLNGRFGPFLQVGIQDAATTGKGKKADKPKRASLFASMDPETVTYEEALQLL